MICSLLKSVEINEKFQTALSHLPARTGSDETDRMMRDIVVTKILDCSYRLGGILATDIDNIEIYSGMQEVFHKTKMKMDEGTI